jgi:VPDSG-CTERM exosortase interaction domain
MKINVIPTKKLAIISTALCALMLAFSNNATAVTNLVLFDSHELGSINPGVPPDAAEVQGWINELRVMSLNSTESFTFNGHTNTLNRSGNFTSPFAPTPTNVLASATVQNPPATVSIDLSQYTGYTYLFAKYDAGNAGSEVWYVGDLAGVITFPGFWGQYGLSGWILFGGPGSGSVPDGGTTVMLLGAALGALGTARRFLKI